MLRSKGRSGMPRSELRSKSAAVELVALDRWIEDDSVNPIFGAVSMGEFWKFGLLDRKEKQVVQDIDSYGIPTDLEDVTQILLGLLVT